MGLEGYSTACGRSGGGKTLDVVGSRVITSRELHRVGTNDLGGSRIRSGNDEGIHVTRAARREQAMLLQVY